jgi:hypothetical protein
MYTFFWKLQILLQVQVRTKDVDWIIWIEINASYEQGKEKSLS